jgi:hypothetical protein
MSVLVAIIGGREHISSFGCEQAEESKFSPQFKSVFVRHLWTIREENAVYRKQREVVKPLHRIQPDLELLP